MFKKKCRADPQQYLASRYSNVLRFFYMSNLLFSFAGTLLLSNYGLIYNGHKI